MYIDHMDKIKGRKLNHPDALNVMKQTLVGPGEGWQGWVMRSFTIAENGYTSPPILTPGRILTISSAGTALYF